MPKLLLLATCIVNYRDDRGGIVESAGDFVDPPKDEAYTLTSQGCALYTRKADDHSKGGEFTAPADVIQQAEAALAERAKAEKAAARGAQKSAPLAPDTGGAGSTEGQ